MFRFHYHWFIDHILTKFKLHWLCSLNKYLWKFGLAKTQHESLTMQVRGTLTKLFCWLDGMGRLQSLLSGISYLADICWANLTLQCHLVWKKFLWIKLPNSSQSPFITHLHDKYCSIFCGQNTSCNYASNGSIFYRDL